MHNPNAVSKRCEAWEEQLVIWSECEHMRLGYNWRKQKSVALILFFMVVVVVLMFLGEEELNLRMDVWYVDLTW